MMTPRRRSGTSVLLIDCPDPVELILYVGARSPHSEIAIENLKRAVEDMPFRRVTLTIRDPERDPNGADMPVSRPPGPRTFIMGHLMSVDLLRELLAECAQD
jgi:hypothetical protein